MIKWVSDSCAFSWTLSLPLFSFSLVLFYYYDFLTFYWVFANFTSWTPIPLISRSRCTWLPPPLPPPHQQRKNLLAVEAALCLGMSHSASFCLLVLACRCSLQSHWLVRGSGFCCSISTGASPDSSWISCCCPVSQRSCSFGSAGNGPFVHSRRALLFYYYPLEGRPVCFLMRDTV